MPTEDPRRDGPRRDGLRIGGWLETFPRRRPLTGRPPLVTPPPTRVPVFQPARPLNPQRHPIARAATRLTRVDDPRQVRLRIAATCLVATAVGTAAFLTLTDRHGTVTVVQQASVADPVTIGPMPLPTGDSSVPSGLPASTAPVTGVPVGGPAGTEPVGAGPTGTVSADHPHSSDAVHHSPSPSTRPLVGPRVGDTVSLAVAGNPGLRVRHRNFLGRVDLIGPTSSPLDHADSRFVVRSAASTGCVAFESVNYPGYFLRHRDYVLHLDRSDGSSLFRLDSSFCPVLSDDGSFRLRSANYPDRYLTASGGSLYLAQMPADRATGFTVATPY